MNDNLDLNLPSFNDLKNDFETIKTWEERYRYLILLGRKLPKMDVRNKQDTNKISECEAATWLYVERIDNILQLEIESESRISNGLLSIVFILFNGKRSQEIQHVDTERLFKELGLLDQISPSRSNALSKVIEQIKNILDKDELAYIINRLSELN